MSLYVDISREVFPGILNLLDNLDFFYLGKFTLTDIIIYKCGAKIFHY